MTIFYSKQKVISQTQVTVNITFWNFVVENLRVQKVEESCERSAPKESCERSAPWRGVSVLPQGEVWALCLRLVRGMKVVEGTSASLLPSRWRLSSPLTLWNTLGRLHSFLRGGIIQGGGSNHRESTPIEGPSPVQSGLWSWLTFVKGISHIPPASNPAVQSFCSM